VLDAVRGEVDWRAAVRGMLRLKSPRTHDLLTMVGYGAQK
jgi:hypothetical protein